MSPPEPVRLSTHVLPPLLLVVVFWAIALSGVDFGMHWDEPQSKFDSVRGTLKTGVFLQGAADADGNNYTYGGVNYILTWVGLVPEVVRYFRGGDLTRTAFTAAVAPAIDSPAVRLRVRRIYVLISGLAIVWLYCLVLVLGRGPLEATLAAALLAGSWEVGYHSRWIAADAVMMQFVLLAFLCVAVGLRGGRPGWFYAAAVAAGLAAGTKYPGALASPFVLAGAVVGLSRAGRSRADVGKHTAALAGTALLTFANTSPGILLDPFRFFGQWRELRTIYSGGWYGYTVEPGLHHLGQIATYVALQAFSHYWSISMVLAVMCAVGFAAMLAERRVFGLLAMAFVLSYAAYFSQQAALIVRNLLVLIPFLCLAAARGIVVVSGRLKPPVRPAVYAAVAIAVAVNLGWGVHAARQVLKRADLGHFARRFVAHADRSPADVFLVSAKLAAALRARGLSLPGNVVTDPAAPYTKVAFLHTEGPDVFWKKWPSNSWGLYDAAFGPLEVNLEAYPTFIGNERILVVPARRYRALPIKDQDLRTP